MKTNKSTLITATLSVEETTEILERYVRERFNLGEEYQLEDIDFPRVSPAGKEYRESTVVFIKAESIP